jgi:hypothetical protein
MHLFCTLIALCFSAGLAHGQAAPTATDSVLANGLTEAQEKKLGGARAAGTAGLVMGGISLAAGITSLSWQGHVLPQKIIAGSSILVTGIAVPVGFSGGAKARRLAVTAGVKAPHVALPLAGWGLWLGMMGTGAYQAASGSDYQPLRKGLTVTTTTLGALATIAMGVDAHTTIGVVEQRIGAAQSTADTHPKPRPVVRPALMPSQTGTRVGLVGSF